MKKYRFFKSAISGYYSLWVHLGNKKGWECIKSNAMEHTTSSKLMDVDEWMEAEGRTGLDFSAISLEDAIAKVFVDIL